MAPSSWSRGGPRSRFRYGVRFRGARESARGSRARATESTAPLARERARIHPLLKSALVCAALGCVGDSVAQRRESGRRRAAAAAAAAAAASAKNKGKTTEVVNHAYAHDFTRTVKQCVYNFFFYGPVQHFWYIALAKRWPAKAFALTSESLAPFATKVFLNQALLGPLVVSTFFLWGAICSNDVRGYPRKLRRDMLPTLRAGWSFWIPAASVNFMCVPTKSQVLYMSACSIVWNVILSLNLNKPAPVSAKPAIAVAQPLAVAAKKK